MLAAKIAPTGQTLELKRTFAAGQAAVFRAWTDPQALRGWFGPKGVETVAADVDLRAGGAYRIEMLDADGETIEHHGVYQEIVEPELLVFTWTLRDQSCPGSENEDTETLVTVHFRRLSGRSTEVTLLHERLPGEKSRAGHEFGWTGCFESLDRYLGLRYSAQTTERTEP